MTKQKMNWLFNQKEARKALIPIGARNLTVIKAVVFEASDKEEEIASYDKMVMYNSQQADQEVIEWMKKTVKHSKQSGEERYVYFRFIRKN